MKRTIAIRRIRNGVAKSYWMILGLVLVAVFTYGIFMHEQKLTTSSPNIEICEIIYQH